MRKFNWIYFALAAVLLCGSSCRQGTEATGHIPIFNDAQTTEPSVPSGTEQQEIPVISTEPAYQPWEETIKMSFTGDCLIGSDYGKHNAGSFNWFADQEGTSYFFSEVKEVFDNDDITVVDCETVLSDNRELAPVFKEEDPGYWYMGPAENAAIFAEGGVEIASVANNHTGDYQHLGYLDTLQALSDQGIMVGENLKPVYYEVRGITVGVLCCNCWSTYHANLILKKIEEMNECSDVQIIVPHGGTMNVYEPDAWRVKAFRQFIDAGAEVVAAGHPHVLQPLEVYGDGVIVYSLGNFCYGGSKHPENATVIFTVSLRFLDGAFDGLTYELLPCYLYTTPENNYQPTLIPETDPAFYRILGFMLNGRHSPL
ncbi:MAG: CapA family protein [Clostridiales bacterium]|nr:CapA family protein [Clostridiales bacterium]